MSNKIFVFGYNKTGTISLSCALEILGYKVLHMGRPGTRAWRRSWQLGYSGKSFRRFLNNIADNLHIPGKNILDGLDEYDCYLDYPIYEPTVFSHIVHEYPDAKYISLTKNLDGYLDSVLRDKIKRLKQGRFDNWNWLGVGDEEVFKNYPDYQKQWIKDRTEFKHDSNISLLFKNNINYLDMNICDNGDGWEKLCKFLDKEIPNIDFPYKNKGMKM